VIVTSLRSGWVWSDQTAEAALAIVIAVVFGAGLLFWGTVYARFRRSTLLLVGLGAFVVTALSVLVINHFGANMQILVGFGLVTLGGMFALSGATPAALGLLADTAT